MKISFDELLRFMTVGAVVGGLVIGLSVYGKGGIVGLIIGGLGGAFVCGGLVALFAQIFCDVN